MRQVKTREGSPRPYVTHYFATKPRIRYSTDWDRVGRAASLQGAARAAVCHLIFGRYEYAILHDASGVVAGYASRVGGRIQLIGVSA